MTKRLNITEIQGFNLPFVKVLLSHRAERYELYHSGWTFDYLGWHQLPENSDKTLLILFDFFKFGWYQILELKSNIILIFDIKENEWTYNRQLIYQQIYIMNV